MLEYTHMIEDAWDIRFPPGTNEDLRLMGHLWEPLKVFHKPLLIHLASESSMLVTHLVLQVCCVCCQPFLLPAKACLMNLVSSLTL